MNTPTVPLTPAEANILRRALHNDGEFLDGSREIPAYLALLEKVEQVFGVQVDSVLKTQAAKRGR